MAQKMLIYNFPLISQAVIISNCKAMKLASVSSRRVKSYFILLDHIDLLSSGQDGTLSKDYQVQEQ